MSSWATILKDRSAGVNVRAVQHDRLTLSSLFDAESQWCSHRVDVLRELAAAGRHDAADWPQSVHWNWARKAAACPPERVEDFGDVRLFGIEANGSWQALLFAIGFGHVTRLGVTGRPLVYIDFIEIAPWNWDVTSINRAGRFRGLGTQLLEMAVQWSTVVGYGGRVGLHSLPQAERFYSRRCRMRNFGPDADYYGLCYLELSETGATGLLGQEP